MNLTDNEIIKALEICLNETDICNECPYEFDDCLNEDGTSRLMQNALDLINRQKTEIERLQDEIGSLNKAYPCTVKMNDYCLVYARSLDDYDNLIGDISVEGIKEFWQILKRKAFGIIDPDSSIKVVDVADGDNLVKEMVGE